jgi:hypothetical protein
MNPLTMLAQADRLATLAGATTPVTIHWTTRSGGAVSAVNGGTITAHSETIAALVHFSEAKVVERQFVEVAAGDCLLDYPASLDLSGRLDVYFTINGAQYVQKETGKKLAETWDALTAAGSGYKTLLLRLRT